MAYLSTLDEGNALERARSLRALVREHAEWADRERRVHPDLIAALRKAELFDLSLPQRAGGPGLKFVTIIETVAELGKDDAGSAWAFNLLQGARGLVAAIPLAHASLFKSGGELFCGSEGAPGSVAKKVEGGYRISGRWPWASGCLHADYGGGGVPLHDDDGTVIDRLMFWAPIGDGGVSVEDTWHTVGMRASGSNTLVADDIFVPDSSAAPASLRPAEEALYAIPGMEARDRWPFEALLPLGVLAPSLGAVEGMLERVRSSFPTRGITYWKYANLAASESALTKLGLCKLRLETAWFHVRHACHMMDEVAPIRPLTLIEKAAVQGECGYAMGILRDVAQDLLDLAGSSALALANPLQRLWRDLNTGSRHAFLYTTPSLEAYGRALVGAPHNLSFFDERS